MNLNAGTYDALFSGLRMLICTVISQKPMDNKALPRATASLTLGLGKEKRARLSESEHNGGQAHLPACSLGMPAKSGRYSPRGELGTASIMRGPSRFGHKSNGRQRGPTGDTARQSHLLLSVRALRRDGQLGRLREPYRPSRNQNRDSWLTIG